MLGLDVQVEQERLWFYAGTALLLESEEFIVRLQAMADDVQRRAEEEAQLREEETRRREEETRRREAVSRHVRSATAVLGPNQRAARTFGWFRRYRAIPRAEPAKPMCPPQ